MILVLPVMFLAWEKIAPFYKPPFDSAVVVGSVGVVSSVVMIALGFGILRRKRWARITAVTVCAVSVVIAPLVARPGPPVVVSVAGNLVGTLLFAAALYGRRARDWFGIP